MLSPAEIAAIKAEIKRLEQALADCRDRDSGLQKQIRAWIEQEKERLKSK